jgi:hypothetical protein
VPISEWEFASYTKGSRTGKETIKPSSKELYLRSGFKPGHIYEFIYPAKNPLVLGLGFAVVRDWVSFLRYEMKDTAGRPNPLVSSDKTAGICYAYGWGRSQSGRFLRDFVYHGFNEDESRRKVFDAIAPTSQAAAVFLVQFAPSHIFAAARTSLSPSFSPRHNVLKIQTGRRTAY